MNALKNIGIIILLLSVAVVAIAYFTGNLTNVILFSSLVAILLGYVAHIVLNKRVE
jgi:uncharacterized membrane-anchored protein YitT (DUF2179 family)